MPRQAVWNPLEVSRGYELPIRNLDIFDMAVIAMING